MAAATAGSVVCAGAQPHDTLRRRRTVCAASVARQCVCLDHSRQLVPYDAAHRWMKTVVASKASAGSVSPRDALLFVQHPPVYTLGSGSSNEHLKFDVSKPPLPLHKTERGGEVTYHGPGQLVMYPIIDLKAHTQDLHWYLRNLEQVVIQSLNEISGIQAHREEGLTGVWAGRSKLCAIGVGAKRWVTFHGLALNVCPDLLPFSAIVPCGIGDRPVGSVRTALASSGALLSPPDWGSFDTFGPGVGYPPVATPELNRLIEEYRWAMLGAFEEVFGVQLVDDASAKALLPAEVAPGRDRGGEEEIERLLEEFRRSPPDPWASAASDDGAGPADDSDVLLGLGL